jgi:hypothetical protein
MPVELAVLVKPEQAGLDHPPRPEGCVIDLRRDHFMVSAEFSGRCV